MTNSNDPKDALAMLGSPKEIRAVIDRLEAMDDVDMCDKKVHFSIHAVGSRVTVLVHEVVDGAIPLIGAFRFTVEQWESLKQAVDPLVELHQKTLAGTPPHPSGAG